MKCAVDKKRGTEDYNVGDEVVLFTTNLRTYCLHILQKIKERWMGPFCITKEESLVAFGLDLPPSWRIHPTFHISKLKCYIHSEKLLLEIKAPPLVLLGDTLEYEVEGILRHQGKGARHWHLVLWKRYPLTKATWGPESHLISAPYILEEYLHQEQAQK